MESLLDLEKIQDDKVVDYHGGRIIIKDHIFEYNNRAMDIIIRGDVNPDIAKKYHQVDSDIFSISLGESKIYNLEVGQTYICYRLIDVIF